MIVFQKIELRVYIFLVAFRLHFVVLFLSSRRRRRIAEI